MNNERRKALKAIAVRIDEELRALVEELTNAVNEIKDAEETAYDNMPEGVQASERGEKVQAAIDALDDVVTGLESLDVDDIIGGISTASE